MSTQIRPGMPRVLDCPAGSEYDEETFHFFLGVEQSRAARAGQQVRLLLASLESGRAEPQPFPGATSRRLFDGLRSAMRETDIIGWYRQGAVAGVVLNAWQEALAGTEFERRVEAGLQRRLPPAIAPKLRVRVVTPDALPLGGGAR